MGVEGGRGEGRGEAGAGVGRVLPEMLSVAPVGPWLGARARRSSLALPHSTCSDCSELELPLPHLMTSTVTNRCPAECLVWFGVRSVAMSGSRELSSSGLPRAPRAPPPQQIAALAHSS